MGTTRIARRAAKKQGQRQDLVATYVDARCSMLDAVHVEEQMKGIRDDEYSLSVYN